MLRYIERAGLLEPRRTDSGYRDYTPQDVERLRALKRLIAEFGVSVGEIAFTVRMVNEPGLRTAVEEWLEVTCDPPRRAHSMAARTLSTRTRPCRELTVSQQPNPRVMER
jgi:DNA-binding transcriptional MerR regulator